MADFDFKKILLSMCNERFKKPLSLILENYNNEVRKFV